MVRGSKAVVGILAGGGSLPREIADVLHAEGQNLVIVGLEGEVRPRDFAGHDFTLVNWGRIGQLLRTFKQKGVTDLVIVGSVTRPDLRAIRTDVGFWWNLPRIFRIVAAGGDDSVLRRVVGFFDSHGFVVRGPADVAPALLIGEGAYGKVAMSAASKRDFEIGREIVARLAPFDVGQAVVVANGAVLAIEGAEGTDAMLKRIVERQDSARGGVLVKWPKPGQELRVDMPAIGPNTVAGVVAAGLRGIAVQAGATLAAQRGDTSDAADAAQVFIAGLEAGAASGVTKTALKDDGEIGLAVLGALVPRVRSRGVVVVRRHVLAVEAGEGLSALVTRAAERRQWGKSKKRRGALTVASLADLDRDVITAAGDAGYEWIVASAADGAAGLRDDIRSVGMKVRIGGTEA
ncbi:MAG: UDP-2,3-diacylglucosamine diphosphatase LpxI [Hyphomicrobium sp.]|nr:UDP-2,3-diacylglucosamine diphosphatase LpxI [Hyphomicrobium sp.]